MIQSDVDPASRTATLQAALRQIDRAAEHERSPDLVVLPNLSGEGDRATEFPERIPGQTSAAIGHHAKQWGVYVSLGLIETIGADRFVSSVLIDRDGDPLLVHRQTRFAGGAGGKFACGPEIRSAETLFGKVALLTGEEWAHAECWRAAAEKSAGLIIGYASPNRSPGLLDVIEGHAKATGLSAVICESNYASAVLGASAAEASPPLIWTADGVTWIEIRLPSPAGHAIGEIGHP